MPVQVTSVVTCSPGLERLDQRLVGRRAVQVRPQPLVVQRVHVGGQHRGADIALAGDQADVGDDHGELRLVADDVLRLTLVMPLTASVESGQSSPSWSTGGGTTAAVGVGVGGGACWAGGTTGDLTSGFSPGSGVGAAACESADSLAVGCSELRAVHHDHRDDGGDHADDEHRDADRQRPATPVDLRGSGPCGSRSSTIITVRPGHATSFEVASACRAVSLRRYRRDGRAAPPGRRPGGRSDRRSPGCPPRRARR